MSVFAVCLKAPMLLTARFARGFGIFLIQCDVKMLAGLAFICVLMSAPFSHVRPALAGEPYDLLSRCWSADELKAKPREEFSRRGSVRVKPSALLRSTIHSTPELPPSKIHGTIRRVKLPNGLKLVAITFDLCEASYEVAGYDGRVIDYLRANKIKATLFVGGKWLDSHSERAQQLIADPLFELGSHGWSHRNLRKIYGKQLSSEISAVQGAYQRAYKALENRACMNPTLLGGLPPEIKRARMMNLFRFPYGTCHEQALKAVQDQGQLAIQWDVVTGDPAIGQSARRIAAIIQQRVKPGSIIIAHANGRGKNTAKALPLIIPKLLAEGYKFVTVSELLAAGEPEIAQSCYENRPGDNLHYR